MNAGDFLSADCRINGMWLIPQAYPSREFLEIIEDRLPQPLVDLAKSIGCSDEEIDELREGENAMFAWEAFFEHMVAHGKQGWIILAETPVMVSDGTYKSFHWGHYYTEVLFAETVVDGLKAAIAWAEERYNNVETAA